MKTAIIHAKPLSEGKALSEDAILIESGRITAMTCTDTLDPCAFEQVIDARGAYVSPGWIELHTHGIAGYDFMDADSAGAAQAMHDYARHGVTGVYPTTMSAPLPEIEQALTSLQTARFTGGAAFLGVHLEGPYFSPAQCGAQPPGYLRDPADGSWRALTERYPFIARVDAAPELAGAVELVKALSPHGIVCGIAHTDADPPDVFAAADAGYRIATHLYSGMSGVHRNNGFRIAGAIEACLLRDDLYCEAITDGIHLPAELLQLIYRVKGPDRMILVTDSMRGASLPEAGECMLGAKSTGTRAVLADGAAWLPDRSALAGSTATFDRLIRTAIRVGIPLADAVKMGSQTPAAAMKLQSKGRLAPGYDADLTIFDERIQVLFTMVGGTIQYQQGDTQA